MTAIERIATRLNAVPRGAGFQAVCPAHADHDPSLAIDEGRDGRVLLTCRAGCSFESVIAAAGITKAELRPDGIGAPASVKARPSKPSKPVTVAVLPVPPDAPPPPERHPWLGMPAARWRYADAEGRTLFYVDRYATVKDGKPDKTVRPLSLRRHASGLLIWDWEGIPTPRPLYRLPELAAAPDLPVVVVEGEKSADAAARMLPGWSVTTASGGASNARHSDWSPLAGRRCVVWPDFDEPGERYAADVKRLALAAGAASVAVADLEALALIRGDALPADFDAADAEAERLPADALDGWLRDALEAPAAGDPDTGAEELAEDRQGSPEEPADPLAGLPCFRIIEWTKGHRNGVHWCGIAKDKETGLQVPAPPVWICDPLRVTACTRDDRGHEWGRLLEWTDRDGRLHRWAMPCELLAGSGEELRAALLRRGLDITSSGARAKLGDYLSGERPTVRARSVSRTGWHGSVFVWPDGAEGDTAAEPVVLQVASPDGVALGQAGTLDGWRAEVSGRCAGNSRLILALSAAFAGPCLHLVNAEGGGLHFRGASSAGKSTALKIAGSVYGPPEFLRSWRATANGLEGTAALHSDLLLCQDELGQLAPKEAGHVAYMLPNGQGKGRGRVDGSARSVARWRVLFLSSGEIGLADLMAAAGERIHAGQEVRVLDVPADPGRGLGLFDAVPAGLQPAAFADSLCDAAGRHYGHAGRSWIRWLVQHHAEARQSLRELRDAIAGELAPEGAAGQVRRVAQRFALVGAAGELATDAGLTGWTEGEASEAAAVCFRAWLAARGTAGSAEPLAMLRQVRAFLEAHGESRFTALDADPRRDTPNRAGFRRDTPDGTEYLVLREAFRGELCRGFDPSAVAEALAAAGALMRDTDGSATRSERLPGLGKPRVYRITPAIWGAAHG